MSAELRCPRCDRILEQRAGEAASSARRFAIRGVVDQWGRPGYYVPVVKCLIRECLDPNPGGCTFAEAGYDIEGTYVPDPDLIPMTEVLARVMEDDEDQHRRGAQKCDPGE